MSLFVRAFKLVKIVVLDYCKALDICGAIIVLGIFWIWPNWEHFSFIIIIISKIFKTSSKENLKNFVQSLVNLALG